MKVLRHLHETLHQDLDALRDWLRIRSISTEPAHAGDLQAAAAWAGSWLADRGLTVETWQTANAPAIFAQSPARPDRPTVLVYGHYDVQPAGDPALWTTPAFEPAIRSGRLYARGAADNKGLVFAQMRAAAAWLAVDRACPVNVKMLIEGEEEIGSPNMQMLLTSYRSQLACDAVVVSDTPMWKSMHPAISYGVRGNLGLEVKVIGPNRDLHSGIYGGSVPNPIAVLCRLIASLHDEHLRIAVPGFYDDVRPIPEIEREAWRALEHDDDEDARLFGCQPTGEEGFSTLERRWGRPTLEFNGITGGFQGSGSNTIVPSWASVKITGRLVPDQDPAQLTEALISHLMHAAPSSVRLEFTPRKVGARPYVIDPGHPGLAAAERALSHTFRRPPVRVREGLSLPILAMFKEHLGADTVLLGFCDPNCQAHSFDEFLALDELDLGSQAAARFLDEARSLGGRA